MHEIVIIIIIIVIVIIIIAVITSILIIQRPTIIIATLGLILAETSALVSYYEENNSQASNIHHRRNMDYNRLIEELSETKKNSFLDEDIEDSGEEEHLNTLSSIRANTTAKPQTATAVERCIEVKPLKFRNDFPSYMSTSSVIAFTDKLVTYSEECIQQQKYKESELDQFRRLIGDTKQLYKLREQIAPSSSSLGRTWQTAVQLERRALIAKEKLNLACAEEVLKRNVANDILVYLNTLKDEVR